MLKQAVKRNTLPNEIKESIGFISNYKRYYKNLYKFKQLTVKLLQYHRRGKREDKDEIDEG